MGRTNERVISYGGIEVGDQVTAIVGGVRRFRTVKSITLIQWDPAAAAYYGLPEEEARIEFTSGRAAMIPQDCVIKRV